MLFYLSRYDFWFPRYRRVKERVLIVYYFHPYRLLGPLACTCLTDLSQITDKRQTRFLEKVVAKFLEGRSKQFQEEM